MASAWSPTTCQTLAQAEGTIAKPAEAPVAARLWAPERIVERMLERGRRALMVDAEQRREVAVRYDVERLAKIVGELKGWGGRVDRTVGSKQTANPAHPSDRLAHVQGIWESRYDEVEAVREHGGKLVGVVTTFGFAVAFAIHASIES